MVRAFLILFFLLPSAVYAVCGEEVFLMIQSSGDCGSPSTQYPGNLPDSCTATFSRSDNCTYEVWEVCCDINVVLHRWTDTYGRVDVQNVPTSALAESAESVYNTWLEQHPFNPAPEGTFAEGFYQGYAWRSTPNGQGTNTLTVTSFRRLYFKKAGSPDSQSLPPVQVEKPISRADLESVMGSGSYTPEQFQSAPISSSNQDNDYLNSLLGDFGSITQDMAEENAILPAILYSHPLVSFVRSAQFLVSGSCGGSVSLFGRNITIDMGSPDALNLASILGNVMLAAATLGAFFIIIRGDS